MLDEIYLRLLLELIPPSLKLSGLDVRRLIEQFSDSSNSKRTYGELIRQLYANDPDTDIGLRFGEHLYPSTLCDFSRTLMTAPDMQSVIALAERYHFIHGASYYPFVHVEHDKVSISLMYPFKERVGAEQKRFCAEAVFSYLLNSLRETVSPDIQASRLLLDYPAPVYSSEYKSTFGCKSIFDAPLAMIELDKSLLYRQLLTHNPTLHQLYLNKSLDNWQRAERMTDVEYRTVCQIIRYHPESFNSQKLASKLNISVRGLQKRLNKQGESFSHLANFARRELAKVYLYQMRQNIDFVAEQLGFQTTSGFRRFFKTEFKQTPAEFIESLSPSEESEI